MSKIDQKQVQRFLKYLQARESIRLKREAGEPWPWTKDPILQKYKFTNVKRLHDRTTQGLLQIYRDYETAELETTLYNCAVYRSFGTVEFALAVGWQHNVDTVKLAKVARQREKDGQRVYTGAYMVTPAGETGPKEEVLARRLYNFACHTERIVRNARTGEFMGEARLSWMLAYERMRDLPGFGGTGFMAKEVLQDFILATQGRDDVHWQDAENWTPVGVGARRGLNRIYNRRLEARQPEGKWIAECVHLWGIAAPWWRTTFPGAEALTAHDVQFSLCEFDKYERTRLGQGKPKALYRRSDVLAGVHSHV